MRPLIVTQTRRWIGVSALALTVALGAGAGLGLTAVQAQAQVVATAPLGAPYSFADLVDQVKPSVVSIAVEGEQVSNSGRGNGNGFNFDFPDLPDDHPFRRFFDEFGDRFGDEEDNSNRPRRQQRPHRFQAAGSGFFISADGYVVTNNHVVENATKVTVVDHEGKEFDAEVIGTDPRTDLALLKIHNVSDLPFVEFADTEARVGDWVIAVGNPFGLGGTVTAGIISGSGRDISGSATGDFIQIDAAVNRGNSGGPAFNLEGEVVGVNTAIFSPNGGNVGIAFAIPTKIVTQIIEDLKDDGEVTRGFLGVSIQDVTRDIADSVGLPTARGALVTVPREGAPAANAGVQSGDVIVEVDGEVIDNSLDLSRTIASKAPGATVNIVIWRDGESMSLDVVLETLTPDVIPTAPTPEPAPELEVEGPVESSVGLVFAPEGQDAGLLVQDIDPDSAAAEKGFAVGDIILQADNQDVSTPQEFEAAVQGVRDANRSTVLLKTSRGGNVRFVGLPLN